MVLHPSSTAEYSPLLLDGDRLLIFLRIILWFAVPRPYTETIYDNSVCVDLMLSRNRSPRNSSRSSPPSTCIDGAGSWRIIPVDDLREMDLRLLITDNIHLWNWGVRVLLYNILSSSITTHDLLFSQDFCQDVF